MQVHEWRSASPQAQASPGSSCGIQGGWREALLAHVVMKKAIIEAENRKWGQKQPPPGVLLEKGLSWNLEGLSVRVREGGQGI